MLRLEILPYQIKALPTTFKILVRITVVLYE